MMLWNSENRAGCTNASTLPTNANKKPASCCLLDSLNTNLLVNETIDSTSDGASILFAVFTPNCSTTVIRSGLHGISWHIYSESTLQTVPFSWAASIIASLPSIYRYGVLRHLCIQSSKKRITLSPSSMREAPSGASATKVRLVVGRESIQRYTSSASPWKSMLSARMALRREAMARRVANTGFVT